MLCNCNNYFLRDVRVKGDFLLLWTDKLIALHKSEIKKMYTKKATCFHICDNEYLYIKTTDGEIGLHMKDKTYDEIILHILDLLYPNSESILSQPSLSDFKGFFENDIN